MDSQDLDTAFAFDRHFADQGFKTRDGETVLVVSADRWLCALPCAAEWGFS
jgi:hypothetical protein